jgi:UDP-N-acetylglucosamine--N-acetylmuramyl-(pentapeptide) pyrophosphoryl-undecaprenol N-acetylglucosamine transferase
MENCLMTEHIHCIKRKIIISGIGTGGHYFPALVVAEELIKRNVEVIFLARKGYMEEKIAQNYGLKIFYIKSRPFYGKTLFAKLIFCFSLMYSIYKLAVLTKNNIGLTFGGFGSLPLIISCLLNRSNFFIFDPNRVPGRATRLFTTQATSVFLGLPPQTKPKGKYIVTGIPVRAQFKEQLTKRQQRRTYREKYLLFIGGSQGARLLNRYALSLAHVLPQRFKITIISGHRDYAWVNEQKDSRTTVIAFTDSPWCEIHVADIVISRAGALAGYEILFLSKPTIFIPYPYAIDNHQYYNAEYFSSIGDAIVIDEKDVTTELLMEKINELLNYKAERKTGVITDAESKIANAILEESETRCTYVR